MMTTTDITSLGTDILSGLKSQIIDKHTIQLLEAKMSQFTYQKGTG